MSRDDDYINFFRKYLPANGYSNAALFPFWDELSVQNKTSQGIYYTIFGNTHNRTVIFEYYTALPYEKERYCHFQVLFFEVKPGIVQFIYLDVPDGGKSAIIGVQGKNVYLNQYVLH